MKMNKLIISTGIILAVILIMTIIYRLVNILPPDGISKDTQAMAILNDASCATCHRKNSTLPFYATFPVLGNRVRNERGVLHFNIDGTVEKIGRGEVINEVTLAKIEMTTTVTGAMPPMTYNLIHWGSSITPAKQKILKEWIKSHREAFYPNLTATDRFKYEPVRPLPSSWPVDRNKALLGEKLFHDTRLSSDNTLSCFSCHNLQTGGVDKKQYPEGIGKILGKVNTPTIYNACFNHSQGWDGHAVNLKSQIAGHLLSPCEMANRSFNDILKKLRKDRELKHTFEKLYREGITETAIADAIETFEKTLLTPDCRFDKYLRGEEQILDKDEIRGYELFKSNKCAICHTGVILGGQSCEIMGLYKNYFNDRGWDLTKEDLGRFNQTADEYDRHRFKVPGLRNVALTKPYFHDGSQQTIHDAVKMMGIYQSGRSINDEEIRAIVAFLETLTGLPQTTGEKAELEEKPAGRDPETKP
jgi:cytochrome c peroxidase